MEDDDAIIEKYLKDEKWLKTGSGQFDLSNYTASDIDICICCDDTHDRKVEIMDIIIELAKEMNIEAEIVQSYEIPMAWGGKTVCRIRISQDDYSPYDFFLVDKETFEAVKYVTEEIKSQSESVRNMMAKNKDFRVEFFTLISSEFLKQNRSK